MTGVRPGKTFTDDRGAVAQLHGVGIQRVGQQWLAWGEDKTRAGLFSAVACYSSTDLVNWKFLGEALSSGEGDIGLDRVVERPKVLQHPAGHWVMFLHVDTADYAAARVGYAVAEHPEGPYRYVGSERPMGNLSRDIGVFQEGGIGYLLSEDRDHGLQIYRLRDDYLGVEATVSTLVQQDRPEFGYESPTVVSHEGLYYLFGSDLTGWSHNDNKYSTATDLAGPWTPWQDFAPPGSRTFDSQVSVVFPVGDGSFVYAGDRWQSSDLFNSPAVWLPMQLGGGRAELTWADEWEL